MITNKEAHMIYGNMDKETSTSQATGFAKKKKSKISDFFSKTEQCCIEGKFKENIWETESLVSVQMVQRLSLAPL